MTDQPPTAAPIVIGPPPAEFFAAVSELGIEFEPTDIERLSRFLTLMLEANQTTNLTAITDPDEAWRKHILDALTLVPVLASFADERGSGEAPAAIETGKAAGKPEPVSLIDIGSGGGVPALPLAIILPDVRFTLVEATGKKAEFLRRTIKDLKLDNARVLQDRAEVLGQDHKVHREKYDIATARALGHLTIVIELCGPLVKPRGFVVAVKGAKADQELEESTRALGAIGLRHQQTIDSPTGRLVLLEKTTRTPRTYPRRDGEPARSPLKNLK